MTQLLDGIRVLELGTMISGPFTGMLLADLGADVIKIENPVGGDPFRRYPAGFNVLNMNKRSVALDLREQDHRDALFRLAEKADVLLENFRPGVMDRLGFGAERLSEVNPRLINCSITGFGKDGPYAHRPAYDTVVQSLSGFISLLVDNKNPHVPGPPIADGITGLYASNAILAALVARGRTGFGKKLDVSMLEALIHFSNEPFSYFFTTGKPPGPTTRAQISQSFIFVCADGKMFGVHLSSQEKFWQGLLSAAGRAELAKETQFATYAARVKHYRDIEATLADIFRTRDRAYWLERLELNEVPFAPVHGIDDVLHDPQVSYLDSFFQVEDVENKSFTGVRSPVHYEGGRGNTNTSPPRLGQHTAEILIAAGVSEPSVGRIVSAMADRPSASSGNRS
jgi:crotonobetainyl-CoA:carnitine CoA-transferase CaiB-like acyl-CoA transferase